MVTGIILAGGESTRAGTNKMLLEVGGKPIIFHTIDSMRPFVDKIIVVTGKFHDELIQNLKDVEVVFNKNYKDGMFSSVRAGVARAEGNFFILPGDCPCVSKETFKLLLDCDDFSIRVPAYNGRTGHLYAGQADRPLQSCRPHGEPLSGSVQQRIACCDGSGCSRVRACCTARRWVCAAQDALGTRAGGELLRQMGDMGYLGRNVGHQHLPATHARRHRFVCRHHPVLVHYLACRD